MMRSALIALLASMAALATPPKKTQIGMPAACPVGTLQSVRDVLAAAEAQGTLDLANARKVMAEPGAAPPGTKVAPGQYTRFVTGETVPAVPVIRDSQLLPPSKPKPDGSYVVVNPKIRESTRLPGKASAPAPEGMVELEPGGSRYVFVRDRRSKPGSPVTESRGFYRRSQPRPPNSTAGRAARDKVNADVYGAANRKLAQQRKLAAGKTYSKQDFEQLKRLLDIAKFVNEADMMSASERAALIRDLKRLSTSLAEHSHDNPMVYNLVREAKVRVGVLEHADKPIEIFDVIREEGAPQTTKTHSYGTQRPKLELKEVEINPEFVERYDPNTPLPGKAQEFDTYRLADLTPGSTGDLHFTGNIDSRPNAVPKGRYRLKTPVKPFRKPPPLPFKKVKIAQGTPAERLAQVLEPGEHATMIGQGGMNTVYVTHPKVPPEIMAQGPEARVRWAKENKYRLLKVTRDSPMLNQILRRDHAMVTVSEDIAERALFDGKPLINVVKKRDPRLLELGITEEPVLTGKTAHDIQLYLDHYYNPKCDAACRASMEDLFDLEGLLPPKEMADRLGALEQAYRDHYVEGMKYSRSNDLLIIANYSKLTREADAAFTGIDGNPYWTKGDGIPIEQASDYNHGQNHMWNSETQMFDEFDR